MVEGSHISTLALMLENVGLSLLQTQKRKKCKIASTVSHTWLSLEHVYEHLPDIRTNIQHSFLISFLILLLLKYRQVIYILEGNEINFLSINDKIKSVQFCYIQACRGNKEILVSAVNNL